MTHEELVTELSNHAQRIKHLEAIIGGVRRIPATPLAKELTDRIRTLFALPVGGRPVEWLTATEIAENLGLETGQIKRLGQALKVTGFSRKSTRKDGKTAARYCVVRSATKPETGI